MKDYHRRLMDYIRELGGENIELHRRTGHWTILFEVNGIKRKFFCAGTPSERRGLLNSKSDVRKIIQNARQGNHGRKEMPIL